MTYLDPPASPHPPIRRLDEFHGVTRRNAAARPQAQTISIAHQADSSGHQAQTQRLIALWCLFVLLALAVLCSSHAFGQGAAGGQAAAGYRTVPLSPAYTKQKIATLERARADGLKKTDLTQQWAGLADFQMYYKYQLLKLLDPAYSAEYGTIVQSILDDLQRSERFGSPAAQLVAGWVAPLADAIAKGNFHPTARVNAALLLALLDERGADLPAGKPSVPARAALLPLYGLYKEASFPDGVRAAALQGLARHVYLGAVTSETGRTAIAQQMLQLAKSDPPAGRSPQAHAFMQRYAIDMLAVLADPNATAETAQTLVSLSTAEKNPSLIATYAAAKVGQFQPGKAKVNEPAKVLDSWAARAAQTIDSELERIAMLDPPVAVSDQPAMPSEQTQLPTAGFGQDEMGGGYGGGYNPEEMEEPVEEEMMEGYGDMYGGGAAVVQVNPQPLEVITSRRRINHVLQQLHMGVTGRPTTDTGRRTTPAGLLATATEADKADFDQWIKTVSEVVTALNVDTLDDREKYVEALKAQSLVLKELAGIQTEPDESFVPLDPSVELDAAVGTVAAPPAAGNAQPPAAAPPAGSPAPGNAVGPPAPAAAVADPAAAPPAP